MLYFHQNYLNLMDLVGASHWSTTFMDGLVSVSNIWVSILHRIKSQWGELACIILNQLPEGKLVQRAMELPPSLFFWHVLFSHVPASPSHIFAPLQCNLKCSLEADQMWQPHARTLSEKEPFKNYQAFSFLYFIKATGSGLKQFRKLILPCSKPIS